LAAFAALSAIRIAAEVIGWLRPRNRPNLGHGAAIAKNTPSQSDIAGA
jgi:hypothetical protein